MNALELADKLSSKDIRDYHLYEYLPEIISMLRQLQADNEALKDRNHQQFIKIEKLRYDIEDAYCVKLCLDRENVPTEDENGVFSLWGRVCAYTRQLQAEFAKAIEERHGIK